jgi:hypothetical protein
MNATLRLAIGLVLPALMAGNLAAQWNAGRSGSDRNQLYTTFGLDPALVASVGYGRVVPMIGREWQLTAEAGVVAPDYDTRDFRARMQVRTTLLHWRSLCLLGSAAFITRGTENSIYRGFNFGADFTGAAGVYRRSWFLAGEFGFDKAIITHIAHSDWYRRHFYPDAKDGWYLTGGGTFHYGFTGGLALGRAELMVRAGWLRTEDFNEMQPPMYGSLGLGFRF